LSCKIHLPALRSRTPNRLASADRDWSKASVCVAQVPQASANFFDILIHKIASFPPRAARKKFLQAEPKRA
jgi:hypothetical protein